jgi:hypothetical protein
MRGEGLHRQEHQASRLSAEPKRHQGHLDLSKLIGAAKLQPALDADRRKNPSFDNDWDVVKDWNVNSRYALKGLSAKDLYRTVTGWNGVMQWLRQCW